MLERTFRRFAAHFGVLGLMIHATSALGEGEQTESRHDFDIRVQQRTRYETLDNQFRQNLDHSDQELALQTSLYLSDRIGRVHLLAEIFDARAELNDAGSLLNTTMVDTAEPVQAFVEVGLGGASERGSSSALKVGRFTMDVGRRRLAGRSTFRNSVNSFSGVDWQWHGAEGQSVRAFAVIPMRILPTARSALLGNRQHLDEGDRETTFAGLYYQPRPFARDRLEFYWFGLKQADRPQNDALPRDLDTVGIRTFRPSAPGRWTYEIERVLQTGISSVSVAGAVRRGLTHDADFLHAEFGYSFNSQSALTILFQYDNASGDKDPFDDRDGGFDTLYGERRFDFGPQGIYGAFVRGNLVTPGIRLTFSPRPKWQAMFSYRRFALEEARDGWSGVGWRDVTGAAGRSIGTQFEGSFTWAAIKDRLTVETGFARLQSGRFMQTVMGHALAGNPTYFYTSISTTFRPVRSRIGDG